MARLQIEISEELNGWINDELGKRGTNKTSFITSILESSRNGEHCATNPEPQLLPEPELSTTQAETDIHRKILVTLEMLCKRYLKNDPQRKLSDAERESLEERWEAFLDLRGKELCK